MADVDDKETRSYNMSRIKAKDTKPEMLVRRGSGCINQNRKYKMDYL
jgi:G:T-mismatch repair DNA endonuclease (very short patch repair protein)